MRSLFTVNRGFLFFQVGLAVAMIAQVGWAQDTKRSDSAKATAGETVVLFDGGSLDHFEGYKSKKIGAGWKSENGELVFDGSGGGDIVTKESFDNFELTFEWKVTKGANSGVMYRVSMGDGAPYLSGPEFQILDDSDKNIL